MNNSERKKALTERVNELCNTLDTDGVTELEYTETVSKEEQFAPASDLKTKGEHQQRRKCSMCKKSYLGQKNSGTCSDACRMKKSRS